jgi:ubiquinone/menaquinone biosynthesis C-methylase UbiE
MKQVRVDFNREREWWNAKAPFEESDGGDSVINRLLRWRELERNLKGIRTILDVGGGTGAFSIPLAKRGFKVTHLDISPRMIDIARTKAKGIRNISFVEGNSTDLSRFPSRSFDLVLNMDGAISFCGNRAHDAIRESCRIARKKLIAAVSNKGMMAAVVVGASLAVSGKFMRVVDPVFSAGEWHQDHFPENKKISKGATQDYFGAFKVFTPAEFGGLLRKYGMRVKRCASLGSLANFLKEDRLKKVMARAHYITTWKGV